MCGPPSTIHPSDVKGWGHQVWRLALERVKPNGYGAGHVIEPSSEWMPRETRCDGASNTAARLDGECAVLMRNPRAALPQHAGRGGIRRGN